MKSLKSVKFEASDELFSNPFIKLDEAIQQHADLIEFPGNEKYFTSTEATQAILANQEGNFKEHSDFYNTKNGYFGPRQRQQNISRNTISFLNQYIAKRADSLRESLEELKDRPTSWPQTGNLLYFRLLRYALLDESCNPKLHNKLEAIVRRAVFNGAKAEYSMIARLIFRKGVMRKLSKEIRRRRKLISTEQLPIDILQCIINECEANVEENDIAEVFLSYLFSIAGSLGFTLSWTLKMMVQRTETKACNSLWLIKEALRLWPVAWNLARHPAKKHDLDGASIDPTDVVVACPYAAHRNSKDWENANQYQPQRWKDKRLNNKFLAFGWGEHQCVAKGFALKLIGETIDWFRLQELNILEESTEIIPEAALAPPKFKLEIQ
jgi:cytochrome P450